MTLQSLARLALTFGRQQNTSHARLAQGFTSPPVRLNLDDLMLKRAGDAAVAQPACSTFGPPKKNARKDNPVKSAALLEANGGGPDDSGGDGDSDAGEPAENGSAEAAADGAEEARDGGTSAAAAPHRANGPAPKKAGPGSRAAAGRGHAGLSKKYGPGFLWGQLNGWYKQTVFDPTASLSAERRGTISMPDIESCFSGPRSRYTRKVRRDTGTALAIHVRIHVACQ